MRIASSCVLVLALVGCSAEARDGRTIVASVYPFAFAAERIAGPDWEVIDLTPPGAEAHDLELTLEQRNEIQSAAVVVYLGDFGFQPQVEQAVKEAEGEVIDGTLNGTIPIVKGADPHLWLDPLYLGNVADEIAGVLDDLDPGRAPDYTTNSAPLFPRLFALSDRYVAELRQCRYDTMIVSHEAFEYIALNFDLDQFGLAGVTPEAEPAAARLAEARALIRAGDAGAVFYEEHDDAKRIAETFADDVGVPALPLSTLESRPVEGDYLSVMEDNLESLREGLQCQ
jgi:zinc transport system substrate-binding protein